MPRLLTGNYYASLGYKYAYFYATRSVTENPALTLLHSETPKLYTILAFLNATGLRVEPFGRSLLTLEGNF